LWQKTLRRPWGLYDGSFQLRGTVYPSNSTAYFSGSFIFGANGNSLYEISGNRITTSDTASVSAEGTAPAIAPGDQFWYGSAPPAGTPFGVCEWNVAGYPVVRYRF
jgi:hypothetical protein